MSIRKDAEDDGWPEEPPPTYPPTFDEDDDEDGGWAIRTDHSDSLWDTAADTTDDEEANSDGDLDDPRSA